MRGVWGYSADKAQPAFSSRFPGLQAGVSFFWTPSPEHTGALPSRSRDQQIPLLGGGMPTKSHRLGTSPWLPEKAFVDSSTRAKSSATALGVVTQPRRLGNWVTR